ncbi:hypothetical protein ACQ4LE_009483 [Meloidogyne hapla]
MMLLHLFYIFMAILALYNVAGKSRSDTNMDSQGRNCTYSGPGKCPKDFACLRGLCAKRCFYKGQCPDGFVCHHNFACVKNICPISDMNCCPHCPEKCKKPGDCPQGWSCYITKCRRQECHSKKDCEFEWPCQMGKCRAKSCTKDKDCPENWKCGKTHRCMKTIK